MTTVHCSLSVIYHRHDTVAKLRGINYCQNLQIFLYRKFRHVVSNAGRV
jgi:hypothetical protein